MDVNNILSAYCLSTRTTWNSGTCPSLKSINIMDFKLITAKSTNHYNYNGTQVPSLPCLVSHSMLLLNFAQIVGFVKVVTWLSLSYYIDSSKLINGFVWSCYMNLSKFKEVFFYFVTWICQNSMDLISCYMDLSTLFYMKNDVLGFSFTGPPKKLVPDP